jgi:ATP-dependent Clp protease ATP-binding subunit ClpC
MTLGLLSQPQELAAEVLTELGVTLDGAREHLTQRLGSGPSRPDGSLGVAPQTKRLLEQARAISRSLGHRCPKTEHILLAAISPELHSPAAGLLTECGAAPEVVRDQLTRTLLKEAPELAERLRHRSLLSRVRLRSI